MIYLDNAAATPLDPDVKRAMEPYMGERFFNPAALYTPAREVRRQIDEFRSRAAKSINAKPGEIIFTAGATESINLAVAGVLRRHQGAKTAVSDIEHSAVRAAAHGFSEEVISLPVREDGRIKTDAIEEMVDEATVLVSIGYVNGEIGTIQPMSDIAAAVEKIRKRRRQNGIDLPLYLHSDASQAPEYLNIDPARMGLDMVTINGSKIYGPKQSGLLYVRQGIALEPLIYGGGQEGGVRAGTENSAAASGLAEALQIAAQGRSEESRRQARLQRHLIQGLKGLGGQINGSLKHRIPGNVNVSFSDIDGEELVHYLDAAGIMAATGAACRAGSDEPSPVLIAIGCSPRSIEGSLRLSMGRATSDEDINTVLTTLEELLPKLRRR